MLGNIKKKKAAKMDSLIGENTEILGDIKFSTGLHVDGTVKGNIIADTDSNSVFSLSEDGKIEGEVRAPHVYINGTVNGNVYSSEHIEIESNSRISGDVYYNLLGMSGGAQVNGRLVYAPGAPDVELKLVQDTSGNDYS